MKKLLALLLIFALCLSLTACGNGEAADTGASDESNPSSSAESETEEEAGLEINYTAVFDGYIDHDQIWEFDIRSHNSFQCMTDELLFVPAGTVVMCEKKLAVYCYHLDRRLLKDELYYDPDTCAALGQEVSDNYDVKHAANVTLTFEKDCLVRFSVMGKLSDVKVFAPKGQEEEVYLISELDYIAQNENIFY